MSLAKLEVEQVEMLWNTIRPLLEMANDYSLQEYNMDDIHKLIIDKKMDCWIVWENDEIQLALTTEIVQYPRRKGLNIFLAGGTLPIGEEFGEFLSVIEQWGKDQGCTVCTLDGRKGWLKLLPDYKVQRTLLARNL